MIVSFNSKAEPLDETLISKSDFEKQDNFDNILNKIDNIKPELSSSEIKCFLVPSCPQSFDSLKENIQNRTISSNEDIKVCLAALIFNISITIKSDDDIKRQELLRIFDILMQLESQ